jgi:hypothetical protein
MMEDNLLKFTVEEISKNHRKIIDDWCKAYLSQLYEENLSIKPGDFILVEQVPKMHGNVFSKKYWFEPNTLNYVSVVKQSVLLDLLKLFEDEVYFNLESDKEIAIESIKKYFNQCFDCNQKEGEF